MNAVVGKESEVESRLMVRIGRMLMVRCAI